MGEYKGRVMMRYKMLVQVFVITFLTKAGYCIVLFVIYKTNDKS